MHPILSDRRKLTIYLILWAVFGILCGYIMSAFNMLHPLFSIGFALPMMLLYGEANLSAWYLCKAFPLEKTPVWKLFLTAAAAVITVSALWTVIGWGLMSVIEQSFGISLSPLPLFQSLMIVCITGAPLFLGSLSVSYLIAAFERTKESEHDAYEARILAQNAELKALRMQIDPHFLFNSLNSISALTATNAELARRMTTTLADFFRKSLSYGAKETITLKEELSLLEDYLEIEKIRFGKRLSVEQHLEPDTLSVQLPPLILQPLLENAIKHGISNSLNGGTVTIASQKKHERLFITVENPMEEEIPMTKGAGMGQEIVRKRLQTIYGSNSGVQSSSASGRYSVIIFFPIKETV